MKCPNCHDDGLNCEICGTKRHVTVTDPEETFEFYKKFYEENRIHMLQYRSLRKHFHAMVDKILGDDYYNMAMDVYEADRVCCEDIITTCCKAGLFAKLFKR